MAGLIFLLMTLLKNETLEPVEKKYILRIWCAELIELAAYNLQRITADRQEYIVQFAFFAAVCCIVRPLIFYFFVKLISPKEKNMTADFLMQLPETLTIISSVMGFFAIIAGVKHTGIFRKMGVFGFVSEAATVLYIVIIAVRSLRKHILEKRVEMNTMLLIAGYVILSMVFETVFGLHNVGRTAIIFSTVFFMYGMHVKKLKNTIYVLQENEELKKQWQSLKRQKRTQSVPMRQSPTSFQECLMISERR